MEENEKIVSYQKHAFHRSFFQILWRFVKLAILFRPLLEAWINMLRPNHVSPEYNTTPAINDPIACFKIRRPTRYFNFLCLYNSQRISWNNLPVGRETHPKNWSDIQVRCSDYNSVLQNTACLIYHGKENHLENFLVWYGYWLWPSYDSTKYIFNTSKKICAPERNVSLSAFLNISNRLCVLTQK